MEELAQIDINQLDKYTEKGIELGMTYGPKLVLAILILVVGLWIIGKVVVGVGKALEKSGVEATLRKFLSNLVSVFLKALLFLSVASTVGIETTSFIALLGAAGLAVGLALQGSLANFAGGVLILFFRPYRVGDFVDLGSNSGTVKEIAIFNTVLTTPDNKIIFVPNGSASNNAITNYSMQPTRRVDVVFGISYDDDLRAAKTLLTDLIEADERILKEPAPLVVISNLADSAVEITTRSWVDAANFWPVKFDLIEKAKLAMDDAGITIPYPQRDVHLYQKPGA